MKMYKLFGSALAFCFFSMPSIAMAASTNSNIACPVGLVSGLTLTEEFGAAVAANTRCDKKRHNVKTMFVLNMFHPLGSTTQPYGLSQIQHLLKDYEITNGMVEGRDFKMIAVAYGKGGMLMLSNSSINPYISQVQSLMAQGVTFYLCENTIRGFIKARLLQPGNVAAGVIPGVKFVTAGISAVSDFQALGYSYVHP